MLIVTLVLAALVLTMAAESQSQARDEEMRWRLPLHDKLESIQRDIQARHMVEGTYVPSVPIPPGGGPIDHTTTGNTGDMHSSSWTGCYLLAQALRYGWTKAHGAPAEIEHALALCEEAVHGLYVLSHVSGKPGLLARQVVYGHGPASEERAGSNERNEWHQGVGDFANLRFRCHPSHHNYDHVFRGLAAWYYIPQKDNPRPSPREQAQLDRVRGLVGELIEYAYKAHDGVLLTFDGRYSASVMWGVRPGDFSRQGIMATNSLRFAWWITGDPWCRDKYEQYVALFGYREAAQWPESRWQARELEDNDDTEHLMASLWLVLQIEEDPELREFYRKAAAWLFGSKRQLKRSPFNYFYAGALQDPAGADLPGALETLQLYPSITLRLPTMNSIRTDLDTARNEAGVLPFNDQPLDNAYEWKGNPFELDRYLAREVTALAVSDEDPMVWWLSDSGGALYQSLDGGQSFTVADFHQEAAVCDVTFAGNKSRIALLATDRGVFVTHTGGYRNRWQLALAGGARRVIPDALNPNVVWAIMDDGVHRTVDLGGEQVGMAWQGSSCPLPAAHDGIVYGLALGAEPVVYATIAGRLYCCAWGAREWVMSPVDAEDYHHLPTYRQIAVSPHDPKTALLALHLAIWGRSQPVVLRTSDGGRTLTVVGAQPYRLRLPAEGSGLEGVDVTALTFAPDAAQTVYGASPQGVYRSRDGGTTWTQCNRGLRIPYAHRVFAPAQLPGSIYVSTPAGLHVSRDCGDSWSAPFLRLVGDGLEISELGGLGYLMAYWPGRYFGLVTDAQASAAPEDW